MGSQVQTSHSRFQCFHAHRRRQRRRERLRIQRDQQGLLEQRQLKTASCLYILPRQRRPSCRCGQATEQVSRCAVRAQIWRSPARSWFLSDRPWSVDLFRAQYGRDYSYRRRQTLLGGTRCTLGRRLQCHRRNQPGCCRRPLGQHRSGRFHSRRRAIIPLRTIRSSSHQFLAPSRSSTNFLRASHATTSTSSKQCSTTEPSSVLQQQRTQTYGSRYAAVETNSPSSQT